MRALQHARCVRYDGVRYDGVRYGAYFIPPWSGNEYLVILEDGTQLRSSRDYESGSCFPAYRSPSPAARYSVTMTRMETVLETLAGYGVPIVFLAVFAEQVGLPLPAIPTLLAAGAFAGTEDLNLFSVLLAATLASLLADSIWYQLGRRHGARVLGVLCRISLEPDSCVRNTEEVFRRYGARTLLFAKYLPGVNTVAPPLSGLVRMKPERFLLFDAAGSFLYVAPFLLAGYLFTDQLLRLAEWSATLGTGLLLLLALPLAGYLGWKYYQRRRFIRELRVARITPEELKERIEAGEEVVIVDLRMSLDFEADPVTIPGAIHMTPEELDKRHQEVPRDREVILYCT